jgi:predicted CopG family antitoxin
VHNAQVSIKTISLKLEAYERLRSAKRYPSESFSEVVMRASWPEDTISARELVSLGRTRGPLFSEEDLERVAALKRRDLPAEDKWANR